jgi:Ca-activated chloride channel family protein
MRSLIRSILVVGALVTALAPARAQQQTPPTFRAGVKTVPVYASVSDRAGRFVLDLQKEQFQIEDNGQPVAITQFSNQFVPVTAAILLDLSRSMIPRYDAVIASAEQFIVRLMPGDRARVGSFSEEVRMGPPMTGDRDALIALLHNNFNLQVGMRTRLWDAMEQGIQTLDGVEGRKIVFVVTDGADTLSDLTMDTVLSHARKAGVIVYWISMTGTGGRELQAQFKANAGLLSFVEDTGGGYMRFTEIDEINRIMTEVTQELHHQYLLGFTPATLDGRLHKLNVRVAQSNYTVRARKNYIAEE